MDLLLSGLRAAAEETRLRILALTAHAELTVTDLVEILGQSQPRISRHLKLLVEAGLLERYREGNWAYYRLANPTGNGELAHLIADLIPHDDPQHELDLARLQSWMDDWATRTAAYFKRHAANWSAVQARFLDQNQVDRALVKSLKGHAIGDLLDVGTGTGGVLALLGGQAEQAVGVDLSRDMLNVARATLWQAGLKNCQLRQADMRQLPYPSESFDTITLRMVLHYADQPAKAIAEAARVLRPDGALVVVDFAPHDREDLRDTDAHRWLGLEDQAVVGFFKRAGLTPAPILKLDSGPLPVRIWLARKTAANSAGRARKEQSA